MRPSSRSLLTRVSSLAWLVGLFGLLALVLIPARSHARLYPYYVLQGRSFGQIQARILFVLDTSASMAQRAAPEGGDCALEACESAEDNTQSRIAASRKAIRGVVQAFEDRANFALMTFRQQDAYGSGGGGTNGVGSMCSVSSQQGNAAGGNGNGNGNGSSSSTTGSSTSTSTSTSTTSGNGNGSGNGSGGGGSGGGGGSTSVRFTWHTDYGGSSTHTVGTSAGGVWKLCDQAQNEEDNRGWPYLRHDELSSDPVAGVTVQEASGAVPPSPLHATTAALSNHYNSTRRVQFFREFVGVRVHIDCDGADGGEWLDFAEASVGDWDAASEVCNHDFYYWPYVDGFQGYSAQTGSADASSALGVVKQSDQSANEATLYAGFYIDLSANNLSRKAEYADSPEESAQQVLDRVGPFAEGGIDVSGDRPWYNVIGPISNSPPQASSAFTHPTVAKYLQLVKNLQGSDACAPLAAILLTDGVPTGGHNEVGGSVNARIASLRQEIDVPTYVVGFALDGSAGSSVNDMACAAAGACSGNSCDTPCADTPTENWDTCSNPSAPTTSCVWLADSPIELATRLGDIVAKILDTDVSSGPGTTMNDFGIGANGQYGEGDAVQTSVSAYTETDGWKGHVVRSVCTDEDPDHPGQVAPWCSAYATFDASEYTFGPCVQSRVWDAGTCLAATTWTDRRLYTHDASNQLVAIADAGGLATEAFTTLLVSQGIIAPPDTEAQANQVAAFLLGRDAPQGWKLPGLANSAPIVVRRIPKVQEGFVPSVAIRDPHCAGRRMGATENDAIPADLKTFATDAWDEDERLGSPGEHYEYQEAVIAADDMGVIHAFQLDSGNELWGLVPRFALRSLVAQAANGANNMGQPVDLDDHLYGVAATLNQGWVYDDSAVSSSQHTWRHIGVIGMGIGGTDYIVLDLAHMSPSSADGPVTILWTTDDAEHKSTYDNYLGETWSRPALAYRVEGDLISSKPDPYLIFGSGYPSASPTSDEQGRTLLMANALTGDIVDLALLPAPTNSMYEPSFGAVVDPAVGSHCLSRYWAEMQETYIVDPAGRLFRWDLGRTANHESDGGQVWGERAVASFTFPACQGTGDTCTVSSTNRGDAFVYTAAVSSNDRIDPSEGTNSVPQGADQFLIAMVSGSPWDDAVDYGATGNDFHSSLYLLVDDHRSSKHGGFTIPTGAPKLTVDEIGQYERYMRVALSDLTRTRTFTPYPGATEQTETGNFRRGTRPTRAPRMHVRGVVSSTNADELHDDVEVYEVTFTVYEPGENSSCDPTWYDSTNDQWYQDVGSSYDITFRVTADATAGFNFRTGASNYDFSGSFATGGGGLVLDRVTQLAGAGCAGGVCGPQAGQPTTTPCDQNGSAGGTVTNAVSVPFNVKTLTGFTPIE